MNARQAVEAPELSERRRRFVVEYVRLGGVNATLAALRAGYSHGRNKNSAAISAHRLLNDQKVLAEIRKEVERSLRAGVALGANVLVELAQNARSDSVRFQAASALLDRGGLQLKHMTETTVVVEDRRSNAELMASIEQLSRDLGMKVVDGKLIEQAKPLPAPSMSAAPIIDVCAEAEADDEEALEMSIFD